MTHEWFYMIIVLIFFSKLEAARISYRITPSRKLVIGPKNITEETDGIKKCQKGLCYNQGQLELRTRRQVCKVRVVMG